MKKVLDYDGLDHSLAKLKAYLDSVYLYTKADIDNKDGILAGGIANNSARLDSLEYWANHASAGYATQDYVNTALADYVDCITLDGVTYLPQNGEIALPDYPTTLPASDVYAWAKKASLDVNDIPSITTGKISDLETWITNKGFVTRAVNDLTNYYLKSQTYTQAEVNALIGAINQFHYEIYPNLGEITSPAGNVLYLIGPTGEGDDRYEEYVYANNDFVKIGETSIDLSDYISSVVASGSGNYITGFSKSGSTLTLSFGTIASWALAANKPSYNFSEIGSKPTTLSGYGIRDVYYGPRTADADKVGIALGDTVEDVLIKHQSLTGYVNAISSSAETDVYLCPDCDYFYDPAVGDPIGGIAVGTAFADLPSGWVCPICGASKEDFTQGGRQFVSGVSKSSGSSTVSFTLNRLALRDLSGANNLKAIEYASGSGLLKKNDDGAWGFDTNSYLTVTTSAMVTGALAAGIAANSGRLDSLEYWADHINADTVGLGLVENVALSTWPGSTNITTLGTITNLNSKLYFSGANVGIGTSSPQHSLDVSGTFHASGNTEIGGNLNVGGELTVPQYAGLNFEGASDVWLASLGLNSNADQLILSFGPDNDHVLLHDGNYGSYMIPLSEGIASNSARLDSMEDWFSNPRLSSLVVDRLDSDEIFVSALTATSLVCAALSGVSAIDSLMHFDTANGRIGIGISTPLYNLDVAGTFHAAGNSEFGGTIDALFGRSLLHSIESAPVEWDTEATPVVEVQPFQVTDEGVATFMQVNTRFGIALQDYDNDGHEFHSASLDYSYDGDTVTCNKSITAPSFIQSSDQRLKTNLSPVALTVEQIASAPAVEFNWVGNGQRGAGSIAQYWENALPYNVHENGGTLAMEYGNIALLSAITCAREIQKLEAKIKELEEKLNQ